MLAEDMNRPRPGYKQKRLVIRKWLLNLRCHRITMVKPAESRKGLNLVFTLRANCCRPTCRRVLRESEMSPVFMVVEHVGRHQPFKMPLIQDDHVVQQVASATSHPALRNTVPPPPANGHAIFPPPPLPFTLTH